MTAREDFSLRIHINAFLGAHIEAIHAWTKTVQSKVALNPNIKDIMLSALEKLAANLSFASTPLDPPLVRDLIDDLVNMATAEEPPLPKEVDGQPISADETEQMKTVLLATAKESVQQALTALKALSQKDIEQAAVAHAEMKELSQHFQKALQTRTVSASAELDQHETRQKLTKPLETTYHLIPGLLDSIPDEIFFPLSTQLEERAKELAGLFPKADGATYLPFFGSCHIYGPQDTIFAYVRDIWKPTIKSLFVNAPFMQKMIEFFPQDFNRFLCRMEKKDRYLITQNQQWAQSLIDKHPSLIRVILFPLHPSTKFNIQSNKKFFYSLVRKYPEYAMQCLRQASPCVEKEIKENTDFLYSLIRENVQHTSSILSISSRFKELFCCTKNPHLLQVLQTVTKEELTILLQAMGNYPIKHPHFALALARLRPHDISQLHDSLFHVSLHNHSVLQNELQIIISKCRAK